MARLGCLAFGGPVAHLAYFRKELIEKRGWLTEEEYADLVGFCQFLPGPASSQIGMGLGLMRAGVPGMFAAWLGFSAPSVIVLFAIGAGVGSLPSHSPAWLSGLLAGVVAIVAEALWKMSLKLCPEARHKTLALVGAAIIVLFPSSLAQVLVIVGGALLGLLFLQSSSSLAGEGRTTTIPQHAAFLGWAILLLGVAVPVIYVTASPSAPFIVQVYAAFAQTGALVFGGGHVVLPMLQEQLVSPGWLDNQQFLTGYGVTQAMPGPIFTFSSYLGAAIGNNVDATNLKVVGFASAALLGVFMPSFGFVAALFPLWHKIRSSVKARQALQGINATVVGLLLAALYDPVWTKAMEMDSAKANVPIILLSWLLLVVWKRPAWLVLSVAAALGELAAAFMS